MVISFTTGIRTEEARALCWDHVVAWIPNLKQWRPVTEVGFKHKRFAICVWRADREGGDTKTRKSRRTLELPKPAAEALRQHHVSQAAQKLKAGFAGIFDGLLRNRGFGVMELPFAGLSRSTINGMLNGRCQTLQQLKALAGPLGWRFEDLAAVAGEPLGAFNDCSVLCRHVGKVYVAAIPLTTAQLIEACTEADHLSGREDTGAWRPWGRPLCRNEGGGVHE